MKYKQTHMKFAQKASAVGKVALVGVLMSAHLAFGTPKIMENHKAPTAIETPAIKVSLQDFGLTEAQSRRIFNSLTKKSQRMVSDLRRYLSNQLQLAGLYEEADNTTNLEVVRMLYECQQDPEIAPIIKNPAAAKSVMDLMTTVLGNKIITASGDEKETLREQLLNVRFLSNFFGKLAEYPSSQYNDLMDMIKVRGDAEIIR